MTNETPSLRDVYGELVLAGLAAMRCIPDGKTRSGCTVSDGAQVRERFRKAMVAFQDVAKPLALPVSGDTPDTTGGEIRCTPGSALTGERVRVHCWTEADGDWTEDGVVTASRPAGRNFVDVLLDDGRTRHGAHNYEVLAPDPVVARDEADREIADALVPRPVDEKFTDGPYVDVWGHLRTDRPT